MITAFVFEKTGAMINHLQIHRMLADLMLREELVWSKEPGIGGIRG
jgi:hypothetical protein